MQFIKQIMLPKAISHKRHYSIIAVILLLFLILHVIGLTELPVFADEAIYIRWAQLIIDDPQQYLFFALNDGKTPLFIWLLVPFQFLFSNQLLAGRILAVIIGLTQIFVMGLIVKELGLKKRYQYLAMVLTGLLPYWFFHHHTALMDGLLTLFLSLTLWQTIKLIDVKDFKQQSSIRLANNIFLIGVFFGLSLLTKIPALLFIPSFFTLSFFLNTGGLKNKLLASFKLLIGLVLGLLFFSLLRLHPAFGQLFSRGGDFLFSWQEILWAQKWRETIYNWPNYLSYFLNYLTWPIIFLSAAGLFFEKKQQILAFHLGWIAFALPIFIMGKVVYPRYLFPVSIFFTLAAVLSIKSLLSPKLAAVGATIGLLIIVLWQSIQFIQPLLLNPAATPFVPADKAQYLLEWSAGYGVKETASLLKQKAETQSVLALSEGYFGTLPDGLLMYLHQQDLTNLFVIGIGQPISQIEQQYIALAEDYDVVLLIGNSHRLKLDLSEAELLFEACRPLEAPCHQVWDITALMP